MTEYKYLNVIQRKLDPSQREVCFTNENAVIAAGAGSGKTQVLATRFAWLVISQKVKAREILTLTFTNKAAAEMYQRIYKTLKYFADYQIKTDKELLEFFKKNRGIENPSDEEIKEFRAAEADLTEDKKQLAQEALDDFNNVHIQTLDSYCGNIVRQCSNRYGIKPDFSVGSADGEREVKNLTFKLVLKYAEEDSVKKIAAAGGMQQFSEDLIAKIIIDNTSVATENGFFKEKYQKQICEISKAWNYYVLNDGTQRELVANHVAENIFNVMDAAYAEKVSFCDSARATEILQKQAFIDNFNLAWEATTDLTTLKRLTPEDFATPKGMDIINEEIEALKKTLNLIKKAKGTSGSIQKVTKAMAPLTAAKDNFTEQIVLSILNFMENHLVNVSLMDLLDDVLQEVNNSKRQTGNLSFKDVTELALKVLLENPDIRDQENAAYKKIMIDEFQDNNGKNRDLLYLLSLKEGELDGQVLSENPSIHDQIVFRSENQSEAFDKRDGKKLFFVGDEKQSIYKFRGADVSVFNELTKENKKVAMTYNYRSTPELIQAFNLFFKNGAGIFDEATNPYEASYDNFALKLGMENLPELNKDNVPIHVKFMVEKNLNECESNNPTVNYLPMEEQIAYNIAKTIYEIAKADGCETNPDYNWNKFAILDRSRTNRNLITRYLMSFNIPFELDQFKNIFEDGVINDFYNFLRICVYPSNINSFAAYLCSPLCGLSENAVELILAQLTAFKHDETNEDSGDGDSKQKSKSFVFNPFEKGRDDAIKADLEELAKEKNSVCEYQKFIAARDFYETNKKLVLQQAISKSVSTLWHEMGYKYETMLSNTVKLTAEHFDMLFELARIADQNGKSVSWFIDELDELRKQSFNADSEIDTGAVTYPLERMHAVQIMTIHKSKGLQFDYVFLNGLVGVTSKKDKRNYYYDDNIGVSLKRQGNGGSYFYNIQEKTGEMMEIAEFRRLIYVGVTRAIRQVYIFGSIHEMDKTANSFRLIKSMVEKCYSDYKDFEKYEQAVYNKSQNNTPAFDYQQIKPETYSSVSTALENIDDFRKKIGENASNVLEGEELAAVYPKDYPVIERLKPSKLDDGAKNDGAYTSTKQNLYGDLTALLIKYGYEDSNNEEEHKTVENIDELPEVDFKASDFGTLVHDYLCKMILGIEPEVYEPNKELFKNLKDEDIKKVRQICVKMCGQFKNTELCTALLACKNQGLFWKPEYEFKMFMDNKLFWGSIDLIFENPDGSYSLVDYKTDREVHPFEHYKQLECYKEAAKELLPHPGDIRCYLYYLRFDETVEIGK
ncbi:MAG: UvrD-helicase domain-containing protein [Treponema sp.]|nr:UvrD-helicase domain-containing protein [Treponema sp.]